MNLEIEAYEGELTKLRKLYEMVKHIDLAEKLEIFTSSVAKVARKIKTDYRTAFISALLME